MCSLEESESALDMQKQTSLAVFWFTCVSCWTVWCVGKLKVVFPGEKKRSMGSRSSSHWLGILLHIWCEGFMSTQSKYVVAFPTVSNCSCLYKDEKLLLFLNQLYFVGFGGISVPVIRIPTWRWQVLVSWNISLFSELLFPDPVSKSFHRPACWHVSMWTTVICTFLCTCRWPYLFCRTSSSCSDKHIRDLKCKAYC